MAEYNLGSARGNIDLDASGAIRGLKDASREADTFQGKLKAAGPALKKGGAAMMGGAVAIGAGLGLAVKTAGGFEQSMNRVGAVSGATGESFNGLSDLAKDLGRTTAFSASEAAEGMSFLAMAGFDTDEMLAAMPGTLQLAAAGQLELAAAADIASNVLSGYGMEAEDIGRVNDVLAAGSSKANTDVTQLGEAMKMVAPVAQASGISFEEATASIGKLSDAGIQGGMAGTTLRGIISRLENPTDKAAGAIERLGVKTHDSEGNLLSMTDIVGNFEDAGLSTADAMQIFGQRAGPGMMALTSQGAGALGELTTAMEDSGGTAKRMADRQLEGLNGAMTELKSASEGALIAIGEQLTPAFEVIADAVSKVVSWFGGLSDNTMKFVAIGAAVTAGLLALGGALFLILGFLPAMIAGFGVLIGTILPIVLPIVAVIAAIAALALGIKYLWENSQKFRDIVMAVWEGIKVAVAAVVAWFQAEALPYIMTVWTQIQEVFRAAVDAITAVFIFFRDFVQDLWARFGEHIISAAQNFLGFISEFFSNTWENIKQVIDAVLRIIKGIFDVFAGAFTGDWSRVWEGIKGIFGGIWNAISAIFSQILDTIILIAKTAWTALETAIGAAMAVISAIWDAAWTRIKMFFSSIWDGIKAALTAAWDWVKDTISGGLDSIKSGWESAWNSIKDFLSDTWDSIKESVTDAIDSVVDTVTGVKDSIMDGLSGIGTWLYDAGKDLLQGLIDGIGDMVGGAVSAVGDAVGSVIDGAMGMLGMSSPSKVFMKIGSETFEGFRLGMESMARDVERASSATAGAAIGPARDAAALVGAGPTGGNSYSESSSRYEFQGDIVLPNINDRSSADDLLDGLRQAVRQGV